MKALKKAASIILALVTVVNLATPAFAAVSDDVLDAAVLDTAEYVYKTVKDPQVGSVGGEWAVMSLARSSYDVPDEYFQKYYTSLEKYVMDCGGELHDKKYTEYSRVILALTAIGADPGNVAGFDLLKPLGDYNKTIWQGLNGPVWALIALDTGDYTIPVNGDAEVQATREMYIERILECQLPDGGFNLTSRGSADPDMTGMALQALAKYQNRADVKETVGKALECISELQHEDGGFTAWGDSGSESIVQVIVALCELGIPLDDERFVKDGNTLTDALSAYAGPVPGEGLDGKNSSVKSSPITRPGITFEDVSGENYHTNTPAIEALAARGIINGKTETQFQPNATMTRAEFAAIIVRALGLTEKEVDVFSDVPRGQWYSGYIGTAYEFGIVNGKTENTFDPGGTISREEAAVMVARAAKLCGIETERDTASARDTLAQFFDYVTIAEWAQSSMAVCYDEGILSQQDENARPKDAILRCEVAQMVLNLLGTAYLL